MAATTSAALKTLIEAGGLSLMAYRDTAPRATDGTPLPRPYVTITEGLALVPDPLEDEAMDTAVETVQVDLWQDWRVKTTGAVAESYTLARDLQKLLAGAKLIPVGTATVYAAILSHSIRLVEVEDNIVHTAITLEVYRQV